MPAKIIDGKAVSKIVRQEVSEGVAELKKSGIVPHLAVVLVGEDAASQTYVRNKKRACEKVGISSDTLLRPAAMTQDELVSLVEQLNADPRVHGILVQLPLPDHIDEQVIINTISPEKDVDGFHPVNMGKLALGAMDGFVSCTPMGIVELLLRNGYNPAGKHVVVIGRSNIVGKPLSLLLMRKKEGGNATVTVCHSRTENLPEITRTADILIAAIGRPEMVRRDMVKPGAVVIDVGTSRVDDPVAEKGYRLSGDVKFDEVSEIAGAITPVPGGVGPMTIALLLKNTLLAAEKSQEKQN